MSVINPYRYKVISPSYNTFIGGISGVVTTAGQLETLLGLSGGDVTFFNINGSDIEAFIDVVSYVLPDNTFNNDGGVNDWGDGDIVTYYIDSDDLVTSVGDSCFKDQTNMPYIELSGVTTVDANAFDGTKVKVARFPAVTATEGSVFESCSLLEYVYIPLCTDLGGSAVDNSVFNDCTRLRSVYANTFLATNNGGAPDGDLAYVSTLDRATVYYVANSTVPSDISDLAADTVYSDGITIDWTAPSSTNAIDLYETYIDGVFVAVDNYIYRTIIDLVNLTTYDFSVKVVDIYGNRSDFSNVLSQNINGASAIVQGNLVSYYRHDNTVFDEFVLNEASAVPSSISFITGKSGEATAHTGGTANSIIGLGNDTSLQLTQGSISLWFRTSGAGTGFRGLVVKQLAYSLFANAGVLGFYSWATPVGYKSTGVNVDDGVWRHIVLTFDDGVTNGTKIYINGSLSLTDTLGISAQTVVCVIGGGGPTVQAVVGDIDGVGIYDAILTSTQVTAIYNIQNAGRELI